MEPQLEASDGAPVSGAARHRHLVAAYVKVRGRSRDTCEPPPRRTCRIRKVARREDLGGGIQRHARKRCRATPPPADYVKACGRSRHTCDLHLIASLGVSLLVSLVITLHYITLIAGIKKPVAVVSVPELS